MSGQKKQFLKVPFGACHDASKHAGWDDGRVLEIFGVVDFYNSFDTLATGMQIDSDIRPPSGGG